MAKEPPKGKESKAVEVKKPDQILPRWSDADRWFERVAEDFWGSRFPSLTTLMGKERWGLPAVSLQMPTIDLYEEKDDIVIKADIPGMSKEDLQVTVSGDVLSIKGEKKEEEEVKEKDYYRRERSYGSFARSVQLPSQVKGNEIKASFKDGVLEVRCPKTEEAKKKSVTVKID